VQTIVPTTFFGSPQRSRQTPGIADLVERVNQGIFAVELERNVKVDGGASGQASQALHVTFQECFVWMSSQ